MFAVYALVAAAAVLLKPGEVIRYPIAGGKSAVFHLAISAPVFVDGQVHQGDTDLVIEVFDPFGARVGHFDQRERQTEIVAFHATAAGSYRFEVSTVNRAAPAASCRLVFTLVSGDEHAEAVSRAARLASEAKSILAKRDRASAHAALQLLGEARALWREAGRVDAELAAIVASADAHYVMTEFAAADRLYREALDISRELADACTEGELLNNLAMLALARGEVAEALALLEQALARWRAAKFTLGEASALSNRGIALRQSGEYDRARRDYARALTLFRALKDDRGQAFALNNIGIVLESLGEPREALINLGRAVRLFRVVKDDRAAGRALLAQSRIQLSLGAQSAALQLVRQALPLIRGAGDRLAEADGLIQQGRIHDADGAHVEARANFERALALARAIGSRRTQSDSLHDTGVSFLRSGDPASARSTLAQALEIRRGMGVPGLEAATLFRLAQAERAASDAERARASLEQALNLSEQLRAGIFERELRVAYSTSIQAYYQELVDLLAQQHREQPAAGFDALAFAVAERGRARSLVELVRESRAAAAGAVNPLLLAREAATRSALNYASFQLWQQTNLPAAAARDESLPQRLDTLLRELRDIEGEMRREDPRHAALQSAAPLSIADVRRNLVDDRTTLLAYSLGDRRSYLWVINSARTDLIELPARSVIERRARRLNAAMAIHPFKLTPEGRAARDSDLTTLSRTLLAPAARSLRARVIIVPDGTLNAIPFAALRPVAGSTPLGIQHDLVTLPSVTMLDALRELVARAPAPKTLAVIADPVFDPSDPRVTNAKPRGPASAAPPSRPISRLPFSRDEADRILALVPPTERLRLVDFTASRERAAGSALGGYRYIHFATHAVRDDRRPALSRIVLTLVDADGSPRDGFLHVPDLFSLKLQADLAVLSACETAAGAAVDGDGLSGLTQAFFYAGAARVMSSLWKVDDDQTLELMTAFYQRLLGAQRASPAAALRGARAALHQRERWRDPYFWAGFTLYGSW